MLLTNHWPGAALRGAPDLGQVVRGPPAGSCGLEGGWLLQAQMAALGFLFQNYMGPLRLVLSPADMVAIFINLEVRKDSALLTACGPWS